MKRIRAYVSIGLVGCNREEILEFEDDATEEEIEETVREWKDDYIEWSFREVEGDE